MKILLLCIAMSISATSFAADFVCRGNVSITGQKSINLKLELSEKTIQSGTGNVAVIATKGEYTVGASKQMTIQDGKLKWSSVITLAVRKIIGLTLQTKTLMGRSANGDFESYKLSSGVLSKKDDYIEIDRANHTAKLYVADLFGHSLLKCKPESAPVL